MSHEEITPAAEPEGPSSPTIKITFFKETESAKPGTMRTTTWAKLKTLLCNPRVAPSSKHDLPLWSPTVFEGGRRRGEAAQEVHLFAIDIDNEINPAHYGKLASPPPAALVQKGEKETYKLDPVNTIEQVLGVLPEHESCWHTSYSHKPDWPKYRVVWPLSRPVTPEEYARLWENLERRFGTAGVLLDPATKNVSRVWFMAAKTEHFEAGSTDGHPIDVDAVLAEVPVIKKKPVPTTSLAKTAAAATEAQRPTTAAKGPKVIQDVLGFYGYARSPTGRVYARRGGQLYPTDSDSFIAKVASEFHVVSGGNVVGKDTIDKYLLAIRGKKLPTVEIPIRVAYDGGNIYLDLGDDTGRVIEINRDKPRVLNESPVAFYRPPSLQPLPTPIIPFGFEGAAAKLEEFRELLGVTKKGWRGCLVWLVQAMRQARVYSILICKGPKGVGKTTRARLLRRTFDPRRPEVTGLPKTLDDLAIQAENAHALVYDNLRHLSAEMSDALCRLATGDGVEKRSLYTSRDLTVFEGSKPIILTSISDAATEPDILDRALFAKFEKPNKPMTDEEIDAAFGAMHAEVLGALCWAATLALDGEERSDFVVPAKIRMRAPCRFAAGIEPYLLDEGDVVAVFTEATEEVTTTAGDDSFVSGFLSWAKNITEWTGTTTDLREVLVTHAKNGDEKARAPEWIPVKPRGVRAKLDTFIDIFRKHGVAIEFGTIGRGDAKRAGITVHGMLSTTIGAHGVDVPADAGGNAPRENAEEHGLGVRGVRGVRSVLQALLDQDDEDFVTLPAPEWADVLYFLEEKHPMHPMHPTPANDGLSSGVHCADDAPHEVATHPTPVEPDEVEAEMDDIYNLLAQV